MAIVLVVIGLIVGGVLVGKDLIRLSEIRAQISQIERYNIAINTFRTKFAYIPGDIPYTQAAQNGLFALTAPVAGTKGFGDGNGLVQGCNNPPYQYICGEYIVFWRHLSEANLIDGSYGATINPATGIVPGGIPPSQVPSVLPTIRIGRSNNYVVITDYSAFDYTQDGQNYFYLIGIPNAGVNAAGWTPWVGAMTPQESYTIDKKIDNGLPMSGQVRCYGNCLEYSAYPDPVPDAYFLEADNANVVNSILYFRFNQ